MKQLSNSAKEKADKIGEAIMGVLQANSVQYAVRYKGEVIVSASVGKYDTKDSRPLGKNDMYGVGSVSKVYVTAAAMLFVDKGELDIDKPYVTYVPEFKMADPRYVDITVRHLMNHASGIYGTHFKGGFLFEDNDRYAHDTLLESLKVDVLKYAPGTFSEYCNDGFQLLEILVERLSGMSYNECLKKYIFEPMGIKNTKTPMDEYDRNQMAKYSTQQLYDGDMPYETTNLYGTGGVVSTAEDMTLFGRVLMGREILSEKAMKMMAEKEYSKGALWPTDDEPNNLFAYGLGFDHVHVPPFDKVGLTALCKGGDTMQYHASLIVIPELDLAAAALSAGGASFANYALIIELLKDACIENGLVKEFPARPVPTAPVKKDVPAEILALAGLYAENGKFVNIEIKDNEIELGALLSGMVPPQKYIYNGDGRFVSADGVNSVHFEVTADGPTFLQGDICIDLPGVGQIMWKAYLYQKLEKNPIDAKLAEVWKARDGKKYLLANELYTSMHFLSLSEPSVVTTAVNTEYGHVAGAKIVDENYALNVLYARDVLDYSFFKEGGIEYLSARGYVFMDSTAITDLEAGQNTVTIGTKGYCAFYLVGDKLAGKTLTVKRPARSTFAAYSAADEKAGKPQMVKMLTTVMGDKPVELVKGDMLVFAADAGAAFELTLN